MDITITFARGARRVTGSNFLITVTDGEKKTRILVDCGLTQGEKFCESTNSKVFQYEPKEIDAVVFTHAHADHIGLYPRLVREGFAGPAYATPPTADLIPVMLSDSVQLIAVEAGKCNEEPPYSKEDIEPSLKLLKRVEYEEHFKVGPAEIILHNAGHIVGSASVEISAGGKRVLFTGDMGRSPAALVPERVAPKGVDVLITESVYGNRTHKSLEEGVAVLKKALQSTAEKGGVLLIPAFSLERTQIILHAIDELYAKGDAERIPVYMDSPLAAKVSDVYREHADYLRDDIKSELKAGKDPFAFPSLSVTVSKESSHGIDSAPQPKVIVAGAGMSHGGRIRHHEAQYLGDPKTTLLLVGYQVPGSLGRKLKDGVKKIMIDGSYLHVRAVIENVDGFSAHADKDDLLKFAEEVAPKRAFVVLGEAEAATYLAQRISGFLHIPVDVPQEGEEYTI